MANRVINTILNLRNNMSGALIRAARDTRGVTDEMRSATKSVVAFKNRAVSALGSRNGGVSGYGQRHGGVPDRPGQAEYRL